MRLILRNLLIQRNFSATVTVSAGEKWRLQNNLARSGNEYGPLTDIPDWSYADGRKTPIQVREAKRREKRADFTKDALALMEEMSHAKDIHLKKQKDTRNKKEILRKQNIVSKPG